MDKIVKFPKFLVLLLFVEVWERFSYYGMRALLVLFLTSSLGYSDPKAYAIYSLFAAICYMGPVVGGLIADKLTGFRNMVVLGGTTIVIGHLCMVLVELDHELIYLGLGLIAIGNGMFKGNITNLLGSCYKKSEDQERSRGFTLFYVSVNVGSSVAAILCAYVAHLYGWHYGFSIAGCGMVLGLIIFIKFQYLLGDSGISPRPDLMSKKILGINVPAILLVSNLFSASIVAKMLKSSEFFANVTAFFGFLVLGVFIYVILKLPRLQRKGLFALLVMILFQMCFFALEMQLGSLINLFAQRNVVNKVFGIIIPSAVSQSINPIFIIIFGTLLGTYSKFSKDHSTIKFGLGILTMPICFFILYIGCLNANMEGKVSYIYLITSIALMGLGELFIAPLVQEQATILAPKHIRGLVMGIIMLSLAFSNLGGIIISKFMSVSKDAESLEIYREGFLKIAIFNLALFVFFLPCYTFINRIIKKRNQSEDL
ncbi:MFS transporter [Wolbachia pipientis]|uniref:MFS transporter n=1 Tax=Wolbachia pipientis TaxID=955 RepID=A0A1E7QKX5_WOLPI|nr:oligopeptide:H+ symporter [Wolbachia pipientis]OEY87131.1 MFS transporter [Wolbachia pipientis]